MSNGSNFKLDNDIWEGIENGKEYFKSELIKEINKEHSLYGIEVKEIARRDSIYLV